MCATLPGMAEAAIGFRAHSGWTALVAVAGPRAEPAVLLKRRVELAADEPGARQPFHAAEGLELSRATGLVGRATDLARRLATRAVREAIAALEKDGHRVIACGLPLASGRPLPGRAQILASHALIHAAEGELFREALCEASRACGLVIVAVKEKELPERAASALRVPAAALEQRPKGMGRALGPPWRQDEKLATLAAWLALADRGRGTGTRGSPQGRGTGRAR